MMPRSDRLATIGLQLRELAIKLNVVQFSPIDEKEVPMKINVAAALLFGIALSGGCVPYGLAASAPTHIQNLQGCFRVSYRFVEDGSHDLDVKDALEWITLKQQPGACW